MAAASLQRMVSRHTRLTAAKAPASSPGARRGFGRRGPIISTVTSRSPLLITAGPNGHGRWSRRRSLGLDPVRASVSAGRPLGWRPVPAITTGTWLASCSISRAWSRKLSGFMLRRTTTAGCEGSGDVGDGADRAVGAEVGDPPAAAAQGDPEGQQAELVVLAWQAGEDGARTLALAPALGKAEEASSEQVGGEVLLGDRRLAGLPPLPQPVQVRQHDVLQDRLDGVGGEEPVEGGVGSLLIQPVE